jgi:hypothetical protein
MHELVGRFDVQKYIDEGKISTRDFDDRREVTTFNQLESLNLTDYPKGRIHMQGYLESRAHTVNSTSLQLSEISGLGTMTFFEEEGVRGSSVFEGYMSNGKGFGRLLFDNGYYIGQISNYNKFQGEGTLYLGTKVMGGVWVNGKLKNN